MGECWAVLYSTLSGHWLDKRSINAVHLLIAMCSLAGLDAELYYVRDNVVSHFALSFVMPVPSDTNSLHFTWYSKTKVGSTLHHVTS